MKKFFLNTSLLLLAISIGCVAKVYAQEKTDSLVNVAFGTIAKKDMLGAVSTIDVADLIEKNYYSYSLDGIRSFVGGYTGNIWGQAPLILVDGIPRSASDLSATEVESITVMKGADAVVLYGSQAAKGVVLITTRRGESQPLTIEARVNTGIHVPKRYPKYLDAASYMTLYNEAMDNDGIAQHVYDDETIYNTANGVNPYKYPDLDFYSSEYLRDFYNKTDATVEIYGGDEKTKYYTNFGMDYNNSLMNYGEQKNNEDLNFRVRGNVDMRLTKWLSASTDAAVRFNNNYTGRGDFWGSSSTLRPNWVSPLIPIDMLGLNNQGLQSIVENSNHIVDGKYLLGGTNAMQTNPFANMLEAGYIRYKTRVFQFKVNATADLSMITEGLKFDAAYSVDYNNYYSEAYRLGYATYQPTWSNMNGEDMIIGLTKYGDDTNSTNEYIGDSRYSQTMTLYGQLDYARTFASKHNVTGKFLVWGFQRGNSVDEGHDGSDYHRSSNSNLGINLGYNFNHKYYVDFSGAVIHSSKLPEGNRNALSPVLSLGWRISDENFFKGVSFVDNLKLTASYAQLNQDIDITSSNGDYFLYQGYYVNDAGWYQWRDGSAGGWTAGSVRGDNPNLGFITRDELRVGLEAVLFKGKLAFDLNYFNQTTSGLLSQGANTVYPSYYSNWDYSYLPYLNLNKDKRMGFDFTINHSNSIGDFSYNLGFSGMLYNSEAMVRDEVYQDDYQNRVGKPLDSYWGYVCEGFFLDQEDIDSHANQTFGNVKPGDLKYKDMNGDGVVDGRDEIELGKNGWAASPFTYGINVTLKYKNWTLFAMGTGSAGAIGFKNNNSYHWINGTDKYSEAVLGRWTSETANSATYPRLTSTNNNNNFRNSTFWMYDNNRFDLNKVQLTYDFPKSIFSEKSFVSRLSVYVSGQSLLTISKERELMEMNIGSSPQTRFFNIGLKAIF
ncbi:MAG: SusC/RagA family TonB-linked outer membrane protein [Bacteroidales bacterium]